MKGTLRYIVLGERDYGYNKLVNKRYVERQGSSTTCINSHLDREWTNEKRFCII